MGLYTIECPQCKKLFVWFSANTTDQRCLECQNLKEVNMDQNQVLVQALQQTINTQEQLINFLKAEVERLKSIQPIINPYIVAPLGPLNPLNPQPVYPYQPINPNPLQPPYYVTSGGTSGSTPNTGIVGTEPLPNGSIQADANSINPNLLSINNLKERIAK